MNKRQIIVAGITFVLALFIGAISIASSFKSRDKDTIEEKEMTGMVMSYEDGIVTIQSNNSSIYSCKLEDKKFDIGDNIAIKYTGLEENNYVIQNCEVVSYEVVNDGTNEDGIPNSWLDDGIFKDYYKMAYNKLKTMNKDEKIGQILLARYPLTNAVEDTKKYNLGGYVFFERDFKDKTKNEVKDMTNDLQVSSKIPLLTAVDEEGGRIVRVSSNSNLVATPFKSSSELYQTGGLNAIREDTVEKSKVLNSLGLNLNLAPVVDVANAGDYIYDRTLKQNTDITSKYAKTVIEASKGTGVSYTLKHFPGYAGNADTHASGSQDTRTYDDILNNDLPPFRSGIDAGAEAVLVSHNTVTSIDNANPASLSQGVHNVLRNTLGFTGVVITDDISMGALSGVDDVEVKALLAGNDLIITTNYDDSFNEIKLALANDVISQNQIDKAAFKVLAWKYYKSLIQDYSK